MTTQEIASRLYKLCEQHDSVTAHKELYSTDATSTEKTCPAKLKQ